MNHWVLKRKVFESEDFGWLGLHPVVEPVRLPIVLHRRSPAKDVITNANKCVLHIVEMHVVVRTKTTRVAIGARSSRTTKSQTLRWPWRDLAWQRLDVEVELDDVRIREILVPCHEFLLGHVWNPTMLGTAELFVYEHFNATILHVVFRVGHWGEDDLPPPRRKVDQMASEVVVFAVLVVISELI